MSDFATADSIGRHGLAPSVDYVARVQRADGLIPWYPDGPADPWDHVEAAMGLSVGGRRSAARRAYDWLAGTQLADGSWWASYGDGEDAAGAHDGDEPRRETHRSAYAAVGVWHHYLVTGDRTFLADHWPTLRDALEFALSYQEPTGEIYWSVDADGDVDPDALVSGCASIYKSLECGAKAARVLDRPERAERWLDARARLGSAIRSRPDRFDRTWESKERYAMDWFYPVLCGVLDETASRERLAARADSFVEEGLGCRCVSDEPWVTVAESCELVVSLVSVGREDRARQVFDWLFEFTDDEGLFWTGYQFEDDELWPRERPTWTAGSALLAVDALEKVTDASVLFTDPAPE